MDEDNEETTGDLITLEIDYGDGTTWARVTSLPHKERVQVVAGGNLSRIIEGYAETNGYEIREIEGKGGEG